MGTVLAMVVTECQDTEIKTSERVLYMKKSEKQLHRWLEKQSGGNT